MSEEKVKPTLWEIAKSVSVFVLASVICVRVALAPFSISLDAPTLISLLLALFSIWLSALFYFKATETSNQFYDNTYKFTRDVAQLLAKMESGFGERLRNLDEGYASMRSYLQNGSGRQPASGEVEETKLKLDEEKEELKKTVEARNAIVRDLVERSQLETEEKERVLAQLKEKETELEKAQQEITKLSRKLTIDRVRSRNELLAANGTVKHPFDHYTFNRVIETIGVEKFLEDPAPILIKAFKEITDSVPKGYLRDLEEHGYYKENLTPLGVRYMRSIARRFSA